MSENEVPKVRTGQGPPRLTREQPRLIGMSALQCAIRWNARSIRRLGEIAWNAV